MKAVVVNCLKPFDHRAEQAQAALVKGGCDTRLVLSDFDHVKKTKRSREEMLSKKDAEFIGVPEYSRNLSVKRIVSYLVFSSKMKKLLFELQPDILYVLAPPNSCVRAAARYKAKRPETLLVIDVNDMWPESLPVSSKIKKLFPFAIWRSFRSRYIGHADKTIAECGLFRDMISNEASGDVAVAYMPSREISDIPKAELSNDTLALAYLGSINNIIDIDGIESLVRAIAPARGVTLDIIGGGEKLDEFAERMEKAGARVALHGLVYDQNEKLNIFLHCDFGLNMMKPETRIGLTMKSVDYFGMGLPILDSVPGDTAALVKKYGAGIVLSGDAQKDAQTILGASMDERLAMRDGARRLFHENLSDEVFSDIVSEVLGID